MRHVDASVNYSNDDALTAARGAHRQGRSAHAGTRTVEEQMSRWRPSGTGPRQQRSRKVAVGEAQHPEAIAHRHPVRSTPGIRSLTERATHIEDGTLACHAALRAPRKQISERAQRDLREHGHGPKRKRRTNQRRGVTPRMQRAD
jgi:hypothetical protein